jgi:hypothetical protein
MGLVVILAVAWALSHAWDHARAARSESRGRHVQAAEKKAGAPLNPMQRKSVKAQHDIGWWSSELLHGAPVHRTGFHAGWLANKAAAVQARHRREEARTTHAEVKASFGQAIREHRDRRAMALAEIDSNLADPAGGKEAVRQASARVLPFPRPQAAPEPAPQAVPPAKPAPAMGPYAPPPNPAWWESAVAGTCSHGGHGPDGETCDDAPPEDVKPDPQPAEGNNPMPAATAPAEMTYDQSVRMADEIMTDCDVELVRLRAQQISSKVEILAAASVDPASLGHLADVDSAIRRQIHDVQDQYDHAQAFKSALIRVHGQGAEYHHAAPGGGASREFLSE